MKPGWMCALCLCVLGACSGGGSDADLAASCAPTISSQPQSLTTADVEALLARAVDVSHQLGESATIAVVDRVGNVLGVYRMADSDGTNVEFNVTLRSGLLGTSLLGLENQVVPSALVAVTKAITGAYLSSSGNAFSTRTANFIIQEHFPPGIQNTGAGPLYGVQFSQLPCGDLVQKGDTAGIGPRRSPLGLAADAGGFPLYKGGKVVGGIGVATRSNPLYGIDRDVINLDADANERIAQSAASIYAPSDCIRADKISAGGVSLRYSDSDGTLLSSSQTTLPAGTTRGELQAVSGYRASAAVVAGTTYGEAASGFMPDGGSWASKSAVLAVDAGAANRFPATPSSSLNGLTALEVSRLLGHGLDIANSARAQIRRPVGSAAQVTLSVVDAQGVLLGLVRTLDAPIFGVDVSLQKARTAAAFSRAGTDVALIAAGLGTPYLQSSADQRHASVFFTSYVADNVFNGGRAFTGRAIGNLHRPFFPDGIQSQARGPLSTPLNEWSPFNVGLQLDLVKANVLANINALPAANSCTSASMGMDNGIQIFPGSVPIYRGSQLVGAVGVSGDGVDQDDMIAFLSLQRLSADIGSTLNQAPVSQRADLVRTAPGIHLRYVQCPFSPYLQNHDQGVCNGF
jgi:uncharacterized protein GlcG (DUF336 family)